MNNSDHGKAYSYWAKALLVGFLALRGASSIASTIPSYDLPDCYIVTGFKHDASGVLNKAKAAVDNGIATFGKFSCKPFTGWRNLWSYYDSLQAPPSRLIVLQAAHGEPGGGAHLDNSRSGDRLTRASKILRYLTKLSQKTKVTFLNESCYSGDLLFRKIIFDDAHPSNRSIDNLCILSSSPFNTPSFTEQDDYAVLLGKHAANGFSPIDFYALTEASMISAAPWNSMLDVPSMVEKGFSNSGFKLFQRGVCQDVMEKLDAIVAKELQRYGYGKDMGVNGVVSFGEFEELIRSLKPGECPWLNDVEPVLKAVKTHQPFNPKDMGIYLSRVETNSSSWIVNSYFGAMNRQSLESRFMSPSPLDRRRFEACNGF